MGRLSIDGNRVYELDEACLQQKRKTGKMTMQDKTMQMQYTQRKQQENKKRS